MCPFMVLVSQSYRNYFYITHSTNDLLGTGTAEENKCRGVRSKENLDGGGRRPSPKTLLSMILMTFG